MGNAITSGWQFLSIIPFKKTEGFFASCEHSIVLELPWSLLSFAVVLIHSANQQKAVIQKETVIFELEVELFAENQDKRNEC